MWGDLGLGLFLFGDDALFPGAAVFDVVGNLGVPDAFGAGVRLGFVLFPSLVKPGARVVAFFDLEVSGDFPVGLGDEGLDFLFALSEDGKRGSLHAACGGDIEAAVARAEAGEGAGGIETDEPIGLRAALGGIGEGLHGRAGAELVPGIEDGALGHGLHPEAFGGLLDLAVFDDVAEDEFAFASGIASVDDFGDVFAAGELEDLLESSLGVDDGVEVESLGDGGEDIELPRQFFAIGAGRHAKFDKVSDGRGDDSFLVFQP